MKPSFDDAYRLTTDYAKNYCNRVSEQCFTSLPTQYRLYGRRFLVYRSKDPTNSIKVLK